MSGRVTRARAASQKRKLPDEAADDELAAAPRPSRAIERGGNHGGGASPKEKVGAGANPLAPFSPPKDRSTEEKNDEDAQASDLRAQYEGHADYLHDVSRNAEYFEAIKAAACGSKYVRWVPTFERHPAPLQLPTSMLSRTLYSCSITSARQCAEPAG